MWPVRPAAPHSSPRWQQPAGWARGRRSHRRRVPVLWLNGSVEDVSWSDFAGLACGSRGHVVHGMPCALRATGRRVRLRLARPGHLLGARRASATRPSPPRGRTACKRRPAVNAAARRHARTEAPHDQAPDNTCQADEGRWSPASTEGASLSAGTRRQGLRQPGRQRNRRRRRDYRCRKPPGTDARRSLICAGGPAGLRDVVGVAQR